MRDPRGDQVMLPLSVEDALVGASRAVGIRPPLLIGLAWKESSFLWWASKFEPHYPYLWDTKGWKPTRLESEIHSIGITTPDTELVQQRTSWGVCQVLGAVAREFGFKEPLLSHLLDVTLSATYGARYLAKLLERHKGDEADALSSYNAGAPTEANFAAYVSPILQMAEIYRRER